MRDDVTPLLSLESGEALMASPRGDEYWRVDQEGKGHKLTTQEAVRFWLKHGERPKLHAPDKLDATKRGPAVASGVITTPERPVRDTRSKTKRESDLTAWQNDLLERLGLDADLDEAEDKDRARRKS